MIYTLPFNTIDVSAYKNYNSLHRLKGLCLMVVLFLLFFSPAKVFAQDQEIDRGEGYMLDNDFVNAEQVFTGIIEKNSENMIAYYDRGKCRIYLKKYSDAKHDLRKCAKAFEKDAKFHLVFGFLFNEMKEYKDAIEELDKAVLIDPSFSEAYDIRGISYQGLGNVRKALGDYTIAILVDSANALAYNNRGTAIYYNQDIAKANKMDLNLAIKDFAKAVRLEPELCVAWQNLALSYSYLADYKSAVKNYDMAIICNNANPLNYINRGDSKENLDDFTGAEEDYEKALELSPLLLQARLALGRAKAALGDLQAGINEEQKVIDTDPAYKGNAYYNIAVIYARAGDKDNMLDYLNKAYKTLYFKNKPNWDAFQAEKAFKKYKNNPALRKFIAKVNNKYNSYYLRNIRDK